MFYCIQSHKLHIYAFAVVNFGKVFVKRHRNKSNQWTRQGLQLIGTVQNRLRLWVLIHLQLDQTAYIIGR